MTEQSDLIKAKADGRATVWATQLLKQRSVTDFDFDRVEGFLSATPADAYRLVKIVYLVRAGRTEEAKALATDFPRAPNVVPALLSKTAAELMTVGRSDLVPEGFAAQGVKTVAPTVRVAAPRIDTEHAKAAAAALKAEKAAVVQARQLLKKKIVASEDLALVDDLLAERPCDAYRLVKLAYLVRSGRPDEAKAVAARLPAELDVDPAIFERISIEVATSGRDDLVPDAYADQVAAHLLRLEEAAAAETAKAEKAVVLWARQLLKHRDVSSDDLAQIDELLAAQPHDACRLVKVAYLVRAGQPEEARTFAASLPGELDVDPSIFERIFIEVATAGRRDLVPDAYADRIADHFARLEQAEAAEAAKAAKALTLSARQLLKRRSVGDDELVQVDELLAAHPSDAYRLVKVAYLVRAGRMDESRALAEQLPARLEADPSLFEQSCVELTIAGRRDLVPDAYAARIADHFARLEQAAAAEAAKAAKALTLSARQLLKRRSVGDDELAQVDELLAAHPSDAYRLVKVAYVVRAGRVDEARALAEQLPAKLEVDPSLFEQSCIELTVAGRRDLVPDAHADRIADHFARLEQAAAFEAAKAAKALTLSARQLLKRRSISADELTQVDDLLADHPSDAYRLVKVAYLVRAGRVDEARALAEQLPAGLEADPSLFEQSCVELTIAGRRDLVPDVHADRIADHFARLEQAAAAEAAKAAKALTLSARQLLKRRSISADELTQVDELLADHQNDAYRLVKVAYLVRAGQVDEAKALAEQLPATLDIDPSLFEQSCVELTIAGRRDLVPDAYADRIADHFARLEQAAAAEAAKAAKALTLSARQLLKRRSVGNDELAQVDELFAAHPNDAYRLVKVAYLVRAGRLDEAGAMAQQLPATLEVDPSLFEQSCVELTIAGRRDLVPDVHAARIADHFARLEQAAAAEAAKAEKALTVSARRLLKRRLIVEDDVVAIEALLIEHPRDAFRLVKLAYLVRLDLQEAARLFADGLPRSLEVDASLYEHSCVELAIAGRSDLVPEAYAERVREYFAAQDRLASAERAKVRRAITVSAHQLLKQRIVSDEDLAQIDGLLAEHPCDAYRVVKLAYLVRAGEEEAAHAFAASLPADLDLDVSIYDRVCIELTASGRPDLVPEMHAERVANHFAMLEQAAATAKARANQAITVTARQLLKARAVSHEDIERIDALLAEQPCDAFRLVRLAYLIRSGEAEAAKAFAAELPRELDVDPALYAPTCVELTVSGRSDLVPESCADQVAEHFASIDRAAAAAILRADRAHAVSVRQHLKQRVVTETDIARIEAILADHPSDAYRLVKLAFLIRAGLPDAAKAFAAELPAQLDADPSLFTSLSKELAMIGRHDLVLEGHAYRSRTTADPEAFTISTALATYFGDVWNYHARLMSDHRVDRPGGYVVICDINHRVTSGLMVPVAHALRLRNYSVCSMVAGTMPTPDDATLSGIAGAIRPDGFSLATDPVGMPELKNDWEIDWDEGVVACDGVNYFTFFLERISKLGASYRSHYKDSPAQTLLFERSLQQSDVALTVCKRLIEVARNHPVRIVAMDTHFAPWGVVSRWCEMVGKHHGIHLIALSVAYENYFSNLSTLEAGTLSVEDMTSRPTLRHPLLGGVERFERYLASLSENLGHDDVEEWTKQNRSRVVETDQALRDDIAAQAAEVHGRGGKVFVVFGKVLTDFAAPDDEGFVFNNFEEWISFLASSIAGTGNLLLVKPHPHELRTEIAMPGTQVLRDLLPETLPKEVIFLRHGTFNAFELVDIVDAGFLWNGTVSLEFPVLGKPIVAESVWATRDYPVGQTVLRSKAEYADVLAGRAPVEITPVARRRAAAFMRFLRSPIVSIPFRYVKRPATNKSIGSVEIYHDDMRRLIEIGDPNVDLVAERFFEFGSEPAAAVALSA